MGLSVLVVTRDRSLAGRLVDSLEQTEDDGHDLHYCKELGAALLLASHYGPDVVFIDEAYGVSHVRSAFAEIRVETPTVAGVVLTAGSGEEGRLLAAHAGSRDYLPYTELNADALDRIFNTAQRRRTRSPLLPVGYERQVAMSATEEGDDRNMVAATPPK